MMCNMCISLYFRNLNRMNARIYEYISALTARNAIYLSFIGPIMHDGSANSNNSEQTAKFSICFAFDFSFFSGDRVRPSLFPLSLPLLPVYFGNRWFKCGKTVYNSIAMRQKSPLFTILFSSKFFIYFSRVLNRISRALTSISLSPFEFQIFWSMRLGVFHRILRPLPKIDSFYSTQTIVDC